MAESKPPPDVFCKTPSFKLLLFIIPILFQCSLLHPRFNTSKLSRWCRRALVPLNVYMSLKAPLEYCFLPLNRQGVFNLALGIWGVVLVLKSLEWGFGDSFQNEKCRRPEENNTVDKKTDFSPLPCDGKHAWSEVVKWTIIEVTSLRGLQFDSHVKFMPDNRTARDVMRRLIKVHLASLGFTAFAIMYRDIGSPTGALLALGVPKFPGITIFAEGLATFSYAMLLLSWMDSYFSYITLLAHFATWIDNRKKLPAWVMELSDVRLFTPAFDSPHLSTSLEDLWSKRWHQFLRRTLVVCGARPATQLAKTIGMKRTGQRISGLFGAFVLSGIMHELFTLNLAPKGHPSPYIPFKSLPGAFIFFICQPLGILIEPFIIPYIPKCLGGGWIWALVFSIITLTPYRIQYIDSKRFLDGAFPPISDWRLSTVLTPGVLFRLS